MEKESGFTIMELMVVIAIISALSAIAIPNMISWRNNMQFNSSIRMVKSAIETARMNAIKSNMPSQLNFTDGGSAFDTLKWDVANNVMSAPATHRLSGGVVLEDSGFTDDQLRFTSRGVTTSLATNTLTLRDASGDLCQRIEVTPIGSCRIIDCP